MRWESAQRRDARRLSLHTLKALDLETLSDKSRQYSCLTRISLALNTGLGVCLAPGRTLVLWKDDKLLATIEHQGRLLLVPRLWCQYSELRGGVYLHNLFSTIGAKTLLSKETITNLFNTIDPSGQRSFIVKPGTEKLRTVYLTIFENERANRKVKVL